MGQIGVLQTACGYVADPDSAAAVVAVGPAVTTCLAGERKIMKKGESRSGWTETHINHPLDEVRIEVLKKKKKKKVHRLAERIQC